MNFSAPFQKALDAAAAKRSMRVRQACKLVKHLVRNPRRGEKHPKIWAEVAGPAGDECVVFKGGTKGEHSIRAGVSDKERILGHWEGYVAGNGYHFFKVGDKVGFYGPDSPANKGASHRSGVIVKVTPSRARVEYVPLTSKTGKKYEIWVPINGLWLRFHP